MKRSVFALWIILSCALAGPVEAKKSVRGPDAAAAAGVCSNLARSLGSYFVGLAYESNFWLEMKHKSTTNGLSEYTVIANDANKSPVDCYDITVAKIGSICTFQSAQKIPCNGD